MGTTTSKHGEQPNRHLYVKRANANGINVPRAVPSAYIPSSEQVVPPTEVPVYAEVRKVKTPGLQPEVQKENDTKPNVNSENVQESNSPPNEDSKKIPNGTEPHTSKQEVKNEDVNRANGYIKNAKNRKGSDHIVYKERSYKLYDPENNVQREKSYRLYDEHYENRPKSYIHYESVKPGYVVRERGYKMHEPRYHARRVAHTYGTWRNQPEILKRRTVGEVVNARPVSEIRTTSNRPVRVVKAVPPMPIRSVRSKTVGRPVIVRRSVEPQKVYNTSIMTEKVYSAPVTERVYTTPMHGYIPRHRLGEYKPKVIDGYIAPTSVRLEQALSDPGGYRERVILEPVYQTRTIPPPAYPGLRVYEKEKIPVQKIETEIADKSVKSYPGTYKYEDGSLKIKVPQTDDEKLRGIPKTQFFDDGKTIMIIDYLVDPLYTKINKEPISSSTLQDDKQKSNGEITIEDKQNDDVLNENDIDLGLDESFSSDPYKRQRPEKLGNVQFLP